MMPSISSRAITLADLPPPPAGRTGWPWTKESSLVPDFRADGGRWPAISIVTPSFNQGQYLEETIRSVLLQGYPNLQYVVMDGGSSDESPEIIRRYAPFISYSEIRQDRGQAHALNKGLALATGAYVSWVNSDDYYLPDAFARVADGFLLSAADITAYSVQLLDERDGYAAVAHQPNFEMPGFLGKVCLASAGVFWSRKVLERFGKFDERLHYGFDKEYWLRLLVANVSYATFADGAIAAYRFHEHSKSVAAVDGFQGDWSETALCYARRLGFDHKTLRDTEEWFAHSMARRIQDTRRTRRDRVRDLVRLMKMYPQAACRRDVLAGLARLVSYDRQSYAARETTSTVGRN